jgi:hypothetical protein
MSRISKSGFGLVRPDGHRLYKRRPEHQGVLRTRQVIAPGPLHLPAIPSYVVVQVVWRVSISGRWAIVHIMYRYPNDEFM